MELNTLSLAEFTRLAGVLFAKAVDEVQKVARSSGLFRITSIPANSKRWTTPL